MSLLDAKMYKSHNSSSVQFESNLPAYIQQLKRENMSGSSSERIVGSFAAAVVAEKGPVRAARK